MKKRAYSEQALQRAVCQHLHARIAPGVVWWHTPNGGKRNAIEGAIFKSLGVKAGVPDLIFLKESVMFALELKADRKGRLSPAQKQFIDDIKAAGGVAAWETGLDAAVGRLEAWGVLR